jgi:hypothetical protein
VPFSLFVDNLTSSFDTFHFASIAEINYFFEHDRQNNKEIVLLSQQHNAFIRTYVASYNHSKHKINIVIRTSSYTFAVTQKNISKSIFKIMNASVSLYSSRWKISLILCTSVQEVLLKKLPDADYLWDFPSFDFKEPQQEHAMRISLEDLIGNKLLPRIKSSCGELVKKLVFLGVRRTPQFDLEYVMILIYTKVCSQQETAYFFLKGCIL